MEHYNFVYNDEWLLSEAAYAIDPALSLDPVMKNSNILWGCFQDISPDKWGQVLLEKGEGHRLSAGEYLLGVSDFMRIGALRLRENSAYLADNTNIPRLTDLGAFEATVEHYEKNDISYQELAMLISSGSSIGGARPKISIQHEDKLYIAKFSSTKDQYELIRWEATLLDMAKAAGINVANSKLVAKELEHAVLLLERFDRSAAGRLHFASAMTLLEGDGHSYLDLADMLKKYSKNYKKDSLEMWKRMTFNALTGNIDDHMRNHAMLRLGDGWHLSPAYDLNPTDYDYSKRQHATAFKDQSTPSLALCIEIGKEYYGLSRKEIYSTLKNIHIALGRVDEFAKQNGLGTNDIASMEKAFKHEGAEELERLVKNIQQ